MSDSTWCVVIVNYRTAAAAVTAARTAAAALGDRGDIVVVDNASGDGSTARLGAETGIRLLACRENHGYGAGLNAGAADSDAPYLLCLNADVAVSADLFTTFERRFRDVGRLGLCAPRLLSPDNRIQPSCRRFPTHTNLLWSRGSPLGTWAHPTRRRYLLPEPPSFTLCDVIAGACFAVRREAWSQLGGMDESFFLYAEDTDLCHRAKSAGWLVGYDPSVTVTHTWGDSTRHLGASARLQHARSLVRYFTKHYPQRRVSNRLLKLVLLADARLRTAATR